MRVTTHSALTHDVRRRDPSQYLSKQPATVLTGVADQEVVMSGSDVDRILQAVHGRPQEEPMTPKFDKEVP